MLNVKNLTFSYNKTPILKTISFKAKKGENIAVIGESGSGKSTLLKVLYGEYDLDEGQVFWKDKEILGPKFNLVVGYDFMKYVAQEFDLMPFTSVAQNIGKFLSNFFPEEKQKRTAELIKVVELEAFANTKVKTLSGGQKQRVALAQALAKQPEIILLDEPFSHIDNFKKQSLRRNVFKYLKEKNITCIMATHDKEDVLGFSDRMIVLDRNEIVANNAPKMLYENPETPLVAAFFSEFNIINGGIVYAHQLKVVEKSKLKGKVKSVHYKGAFNLIEAELNGTIVFFENDSELQSGREIYLKIEK
ncbi:ABC transporter ATP-binding protein [Algibacter sp. 2305UL17-15]|uniref:ABC transporter ATP-binding protein n=1 Tax=Algibacter sp. 2305UL17-15 TaxID=3231268 RepID=UPI00345910CA